MFRVEKFRVKEFRVVKFRVEEFRIDWLIVNLEIFSNYISKRNFTINSSTNQQLSTTFNFEL